MPEPTPQDHVICERCGGSGTEQHWYGPFLSKAKLPKKYHAQAYFHLHRRGEILKLIDRTIAQQFLSLLKSPIPDEELLTEAQIRLDRAIDDRLKDDNKSSTAAMFSVITYLVWILEGQFDE